MSEQQIVILKFEPDCDESGLGADVEVFHTREAAEEFARKNYVFATVDGAPTGSAETIPTEEGEEPQSGTVDIYSSFIRS